VADQPKGQVIDQSPSAGSSERKGSTVTVVVSKGPGAVTVPNVVGESKDAAISDLHASSLAARVVTQTTTDANADGLVQKQTPGAGNRLPRGEAVTIFVGKFKEPPPTTTSSTTSSTTSTGG
jgi:serine/threonine-protein kinase